MICPICQKKMIEKNSFNKPLYYCSSCNFLTKGLELAEAKQKCRYDSHVCDDKYLIYMEGVYQKIEPYIKPKMVLDFGCGKIHALSDILNKHNFIADYYDKYYYDLDLTSKYDTIILIEVIEHILDLHALFKKLMGLLNSKGRIIIMTNFIPKDIETWWYLRDSTHVNFYSEKAFLSLQNIYDFQVIYSNKKDLIVLEKLN